MKGLTNDEVGIELMGHWHDYLLKGIHIVSITSAFVQPGDIDVPEKCQLSN